MTGPRVEVTSADIARLAGVRPSAVTNWRRRHADFPAAVGGTDKSPTFDLSAITTWLQEHGRLVQLPGDEALWRAIDTAAGDDWSLATATAMIGLVLLDRHRHAEQPPPHSAKEFQRALLRAMDTVVFGHANAAAGLHSLLPPVTELSDDQVHVLRAAVDAAAHSSPPRVFDHLCGRYLDTATPLGYTATAPELAALMLDLAGPGTGTLLDPACGTGEMLLGAHDRGYRQLLGQELNPAMATLAALRLAFASGKRTDPLFDIFEGDSLRKDALPLRHATTVVCNPPFGERNWGHEELTLDPRWEYGLPPRGDSELAWVQHALAHTVQGGTVVIVMPPAAATRPSGRRIRRHLITRGALQAVFSLPPRLAAQYQVALHLWILRRPDETPSTSRILLADLSGHDTDSDGALAEFHEQLVNLWRDFRAGKGTEPVADDAARVVSAVDLLDDDVDITPRRYLPLPSSAGVSKEHLVDLRTGFASALKSLGAAIPDLPDLPRTEPSRTVTVHDLVQMGAVFLRRSAPTQSQDEPIGAAVRVVSAGDLIEGRPPRERADVYPDPLMAVRAHDVLVPVAGSRFVARVAADDYAGAYLTSSVMLLRPDHGVIDPWFLAAYLSSSDGSFQAASSASSVGMQRFDPRRVRVPLPSLDIQRRYGAIYRAVSDFERRLRHLNRQGHSLISTFTDALAADLAGPMPNPSASVTADSLAHTTVGSER